jgi:hypothetical protein
MNVGREQRHLGKAPSRPCSRKSMGAWEVRRLVEVLAFIEAHRAKPRAAIVATCRGQPR